MTRRIRKRMYAVSKDGLGIIAGTLAYSRASAIEHFILRTPTLDSRAWERFKRAGYRTVMAQIKIIPRPPREAI